MNLLLLNFYNVGILKWYFT